MKINCKITSYAYTPLHATADLTLAKEAPVSIR